MLVNVLLSCKLPDVLHLVLKAGQTFILDYIQFNENTEYVFVGGKGLRMHTLNVLMSLFIHIMNVIYAVRESTLLNPIHMHLYCKCKRCSCDERG